MHLYIISHICSVCMFREKGETEIPARTKEQEKAEGLRVPMGTCVKVQCVRTSMLRIVATRGHVCAHAFYVFVCANDVSAQRALQQYLLDRQTQEKPLHFVQ